MGDVVSIEVDGELGPPPLDGDRRPPRLGMPLAVLFVVALIGAIGWTVSRPASAPQATAPVPTTAPAIVSTTTTPRLPTTTSPPEPPGPIEGAQAALDAWGRFAGSGDLGELAEHFAPNGDQLARLRLEAGTLTVGDPYRIRLANPSAVDEGTGTVTVTGDVIWTRADEPEQHYRWAIELQRSPSAWLLVTVRTVN